MKHFKKTTATRITAALLSFAMLFGLTACGGTGSGSASAGTGASGKTQEAGSAALPAGPATTTVTYRGEEVEVTEVPRISLEGLHATPLEGKVIKSESPQADQVRMYVLESTGLANPGNHGTKEGMTYLLVENPLDIGAGYGLYSYHLKDGVRPEKQDSYNEIRVHPRDSYIRASSLFNGDISEYEVDITQYDMEKKTGNQADELAAARVYREVKNPKKMYVFVDAITETRIVGDMMVLLVKDGVIVNSISWEDFGTILGDSRTVDWRFNFEEDYDSVYIQLDITAYNDGETF